MTSADPPDPSAPGRFLFWFGARAEPEAEAGRRRRLRLVALGLTGLLLVTGAAGWGLYRKLDGNISTDLSAVEELERYEAERPPPGPGRARNILIIGSDANADGPAHSDTVILLHLAGDRRSAAAVSFPRDLLVDIPRCTGTDGRVSEAQNAQLNWAYGFGGAGCTIRTLERLTAIRIDHHLIIDFAGFEDLVDAVGGVEMRFPAPVRDRAAQLDLPAGTHNLNGADALAYVRARKEMGDGSDTGRIARQQEFLSALTRKLHSTGVLLNPTRLYPVLDTATSSITVDAGLGSLTRLYDLIREVRTVPEGRTLFLTVPREAHAPDAQRDVLAQPQADELFEQLRRDLPVTLPPAETAAGDGGGRRDDGPSGPAFRSSSAHRVSPLRGTDVVGDTRG